MTVQDNRAADTSHMNFEPGSWQEATYELYVGLYVGMAHSFYFGKLFLADYVSKPAAKALGYAEEEKQRAPASEGPHELKVIGVGYGRTGTVSIYILYCSRPIKGQQEHGRSIVVSEQILDSSSHEGYASCLFWQIRAPRFAVQIRHYRKHFYQSDYPLWRKWLSPHFFDGMIWLSQSYSRSSID